MNRINKWEEVDISYIEVIGNVFENPELWSKRAWID